MQMYWRFTASIHVSRHLCHAGCTATTCSPSCQVNLDEDPASTRLTRLGEFSWTAFSPLLFLYSTFFLYPIFSRSCLCPVFQLKNYEQAVIEKRFSELEEEEVDALLDEVNEQ